MSPRPLGYATIAVLQALADGSRYGFDVLDRTGLPSGTVYPALASLERRSHVKSRWEKDDLARDEGRPRRRYYTVTTTGRTALAAALERLNAMGLTSAPMPQPNPVEG